MENKLDRIYAEINQRTQERSEFYYRPLNEQDSKLIRADYAKKVLIPIDGNEFFEFCSQSGLLLAKGYERVVIGDYGAYVEFSREQIQHDSICDKFIRKKAPRQKYWWMESNDEYRIKIYEQIRVVSYADYRPGMFYIAPIDLYIDGICLYH